MRNQSVSCLNSWSRDRCGELATRPIRNGFAFFSGQLPSCSPARAPLHPRLCWLRRLRQIPRPVRRAGYFACQHSYHEAGRTSSAVRSQLCEEICLSILCAPWVQAAWPKYRYSSIESKGVDITIDHFVLRVTAQLPPLSLKETVSYYICSLLVTGDTYP